MMQVVAKYSDGGCQYVTNSVDVSHPDMYTPGYKTVTLKYTDGKGTMKSTSYSIYIEEPSVQLNYSEITLDVGKTMSDVEKIISDIIQTTSDLFSPACNTLKNSSLQG